MSEAAPRIASYQADAAEVGRVLLLYSGGLDTSVMCHWIQARYGAEIVTLTVDLGQPGEDWEVVVGKARKLGAIEAIRDDARERFAEDYVLAALRANALYGGGYPLFTALARPLIASLAVDHARRTGCDTIAHGCTGKGNDQVRIDGTIAALDPELRVLAPVREWSMGREEEIAYAREHSIPVRGGTERPPYSIDDNLWGRSSEGRSIEDLSEPPADDIFDLVTRPELAPDEPELARVEFERGRPVAIDGERLGLVKLIDRATELGARHGVGIVDHIEDRIVGLKVRDIYEVPAATILIAAHRELEQLVSTIHQNNFKRALEDKWAYLCYAGLWLEPLRTDLDAYMNAANEQVTGEVTMKLYKGSATVVARSSPYALYDQSLAGFGESGGSFSQAASPGFIELFTLSSRIAHRVRSGDVDGRECDRVEEESLSESEDDIDDAQGSTEPDGEAVDADGEEDLDDEAAANAGGAEWERVERGAANGEEVDNEALMRATQLALDGSDRATIESKLREEFGIEDPAPIVDGVLGSD